MTPGEPIMVNDTISVPDWELVETFVLASVVVKGKVNAHY